MERTIIRGVVGICIAAGLAVTGYAQGVYWESTRSGGRMGEKVAVEKMYYMPKKFKMESSDEAQAMILRLDKELMTSIETKEKTYWEMTFAEMGGMMKKAGSKMDAQVAEMQKEMEGMPEEQRKMMEGMMKDRMPGKKEEGSKIEVTKAGERKTISGYSCTKFTLTRDGKELLAVWASKEVKEFDTIRKDFEEFQKRMMEMNPMMPKGLADGMRKIEGFPVETDMPGGMKQVVTKIEKRSISAGEFEVPAGYSKVKPPMMGDEQEKKVE